MKYNSVYFSVLIILFCAACSTTVTNVSDIGLTDNEYDRDFFQVKSNSKLDKLVNSVKMINCMAYYQSYLFNKNSNITKKNIADKNLDSEAAVKKFSTETASGTATIIHSYKGKIALLTCAHILDFPDTLITFFKDNAGLNTDIIESVSIKSRQTNILPELIESNRVEIIAIDSETDIAIVGSDVPALISNKLVPLDVNLGIGNDLSWGTKVYIIGYPLNNKMITTGVVSPSQIEGKNYFFVDAVFNRGFSGGVVLALRDGAPNFELVGMVKSGTVHRKFNLVPDDGNPDFSYLPKIPYNGEILVQEETEIKYGVTKIMSVETLIEFFSQNNNLLKDLGYNFKYFL